MQSNRSRTALAEPATRAEAPEEVSIARRRADSAPPQAELDSFGRRLLLDLDVGLSLARTAHLYPHIVNRLALVWNDAKQLESYLESILITDRTTRMGLDFSVLCELNEIQDVRLSKLRRVPSYSRR